MMRMLTTNVAAIIQAFKTKLEVKTVQHVSVDEIGHISLLLRGYLGLIQSQFTTPDDSSLASEQYVTSLLKLMSQLIPIQHDKLQRLKHALLENLLAEVDSLIDTIGAQCPESHSQHALQALQHIRQHFRDEVLSCIDNPQWGSLDILQKTFELQHQLQDALAPLQTRVNSEKFTFYQEHCALVVTSYFKKMTQTHTLEQDHQHCTTFIAYAQLGESLENF